MRRIRRISAVAGVALLVAGTIGARASAQSPPASLGGYGLDSVGDALALTYDNSSLGVPADPAAEIDIVHATAKLQAGPSSYGLASLLWPGAVAANAGPALGGLPSYPVRAEAAFPAGPKEASFPPEAGADAQMRASADEDRSEAFSTVASTGVTGVFSTDSLTSKTISTLTGQVAKSEALVTSTGLSLAGGQVTIGSVETRIFAQSDGVKASVGGQTSVVGMEVGGIPVRLDGNGIHVQGESNDLGAAVLKQAVNMILNQLGITFALSDAVDLVKGPSASRALGGLIITFEPTFVAQVWDSLPDELKQQLGANLPAAATDFDTEMRLTVAGAAVNATAAPGIPPFEFEPPKVPVPAGGGGTTSSGGGGDGGSSGPTGEVASTGPPDTGSTGGNALPVSAAGFAGIAIWLGVGAMLLAAATSRPLVWAADQVFARRAGAGCVLGEKGGG